MIDSVDAAENVVILECAQKYKEGHDAEIYLYPVANTASGLRP